MHKHDDDNIPVLLDIIHEHDARPADEPEADQKQKTLWDDETDDFDETPAASASPAEYTWDEPAAGFLNDEFSGELPDHADAMPIDEPAALLRDEQAGDSIDTGADAAAEAVDDSVDAIDAERDHAAYDEPVHGIPPALEDGSSSDAEQIDVDALAERILRRMIPDLEDYLREHIRSALQTALEDELRD